MKNSPPWRSVVYSDDTGRFTPEQIEEAVRVVKERSAIRAAVSAGRPMVVRERRAPYGASSRPEPAAGAGATSIDRKQPEGVRYNLKGGEKAKRSKECGSVGNVPPEAEGAARKRTGRKKTTGTAAGG